MALRCPCGPEPVENSETKIGGEGKQGSMEVEAENDPRGKKAFEQEITSGDDGSENRSTS